MTQRVAAGFLSVALSFGLLAPAQAEQIKSVVELFTSQGCSSCPPADRFLGTIARAPDVLALSFPVDYWDYIGWKDTYAKPAYTARQHAYASARGDGEVYTPQAVIDGTGRAVGSEEASVLQLMSAKTLIVPVRLDGTAVHVGAGKGPATLWLLKIAKSRDVAIGRGENKGHTVTYTNIVRDMSRLGDWNGTETSFNLPVRLADDDMDGYAVILQAGSAGRPGAILGAAKSDGL